ncbi:MAG: SH3 domain-containing protein [Chloroflexi bacterium]|nr:SH3 domain-containing protein [Chloroflexota bacterium]
MKPSQTGAPTNIVVDLSSLSRVSSFAPNWRLISGIAGGVALLGFFLPWVSVLSIVSYTWSGFEMAVGPTVQTLLGPQRAQGGPGLWLFALGAIAIIGLAARVQTARVAAISVMAIAAICVLLLLLVSSGLGSQQNLFARISISFGLWFSMLAMIAAAVGGFLGFRAARTGSWVPAPGADVLTASATPLRSRPALWSPPGESVSAGTRVAVISVDGDSWLQVRTEDGRTGFLPVSSIRAAYGAGSNRSPNAVSRRASGETSPFSED